MRKNGEKVQVNARYGRLVVLSLLTSIQGKGVRRLMACVKCDCGTEKIVRADTLKDVGGTRSCGCLMKEQKREMCLKRNKETAKFESFSSRFPRTWLRWRSMICRCYYTKQKAYAAYGAKGVIVCKFLRESPWNLKAVIGLSRKSKPSLDRFPIHDGNYTCGQCEECVEKGWGLNVRWATRQEQSLNRGDFNVYLTAFGKTLTRSQWGELSGIDEWRIHRRIHELGWTVEKALTTPDKQGNCYKP